MADRPDALSPPTPPVESFAALIHWLATTYHGGVLWRIAHHLGRHPSLIDQWSKGLTHHPSVESLRAISKGYGLPMAWLLGLVYGAEIEVPVGPIARPPSRPRRPRTAGSAAQPAPDGERAASDNFSSVKSSTSSRKAKTPSDTRHYVNWALLRAA